MAGNDCAGSVHACRLRVARLEPNGVPKPGANNLLVTDALVRIAFAPNKVEGENFQGRNGSGALCVHYRERDVTDFYTASLEICTPDVELHEMLAGGLVLTQGGDSTGYGVPRLGEIADEDGVSIEAWSRAIIGGVQASERPWWWWVLPRTFWSMDEKAAERGIMGNVFTGVAFENENWHDGPENDWPHVSDRAVLWDRTDDIPESVCGYQTLAAS